MYKILIDQHSVNDATSFYLSVIEEALEQEGISYLRTENLEDIEEKDIVVVIESATFYKVWKRNKKQRIVLWAQGIFPEETALAYPPGIKQFLRKRYWRFKERIAIKNAAFLFFVSEEMRRHYQRVYGYRGSNYYVMPCFNLPFDGSSFEIAGKFERPTFVYAGNLSAWQCVRETLAAYKEIEAILPGSRLTLLTAEHDKALRLIDEAGVKDVDIKYVPVANVQQELKKYKYGFLLRQDIEVNRVATPTKLNSYMAAGVIPILSDYIIAFRENLSRVEYIVRVGDPADSKSIAQAVKRLDDLRIDPQAIRLDYRKVFDTYYNKECYLREFKTKLPRL